MRGSRFSRVAYSVGVGGLLTKAVANSFTATRLSHSSSRRTRRSLSQFSFIWPIIKVGGYSRKELSAVFFYPDRGFHFRVPTFRLHVVGLLGTWWSRKWTNRARFFRYYRVIAISRAIARLRALFFSPFRIAPQHFPPSAVSHRKNDRSASLADAIFAPRRAPSRPISAQNESAGKWSPDFCATFSSRWCIFSWRAFFLQTCAFFERSPPRVCACVRRAYKGGHTCAAARLYALGDINFPERVYNLRVYRDSECNFFDRSFFFVQFLVNKFDLEKGKKYEK